MILLQETEGFPAVVCGDGDISAGVQLKTETCAKGQVVFYYKDLGYSLFLSRFMSVFCGVSATEDRNIQREFYHKILPDSMMDRVRLDLTFPGKCMKM